MPNELKQENGRINQQLQTNHNVTHRSTHWDSARHSKTVPITCDTDMRAVAFKLIFVKIQDMQEIENPPRTDGYKQSGNHYGKA